jgi:(E)-4-hydroxy-3-methylbut-2-enyl-diphosphate synthase
LRRKNRSAFGKVGIGSEHPASIQSNIDANVSQVADLYSGGCEMVRLAVPKPADVAHLEK